MTITVQLFAVARQWAGRDRIDVELPEMATVAQLRDQLAAEIPELASQWNRVLVAVNQEYAVAETPLTAGDDVALIPPVSGG